MKIVLVEDDKFQANWIAEALTHEFPLATVEQFHTLSRFHSCLGNLNLNPPDLVVADVLMTWASPGDFLKPPSDVREYSPRTGICIQRWLAANVNTSFIPIIFFSELSRDELARELESLPRHVFFFQKGDDLYRLMRLVHSLFLASGHEDHRSRSDAEAADKKVFISYSHRDVYWFHELKITLRPFVRDGSFIAWDDTMIGAGDEWKKTLRKNIQSCSAAILLVSRYFFASDFIAQNELPPLLDAAASRGLAIIWIAVSASPYEHSKISAYQAANDPSRPLDSLNPADQSKELVKIAQMINAKLSDR